MLWSRFILNDILQIPGTLGTFYLVLTVFQTVVKLVCLIFTLMIRREIIDYLRDPEKSSTVRRDNMFQFIPTFMNADRPTTSVDTEASPLLKGRESPSSFEKIRKSSAKNAKNIEQSKSGAKDVSPDASGNTYKGETNIKINNNNSNNNNNNNNNNNSVGPKNKKNSEGMRKKTASPSGFQYESFGSSN